MNNSTMLRRSGVLLCILLLAACGGSRQQTLSMPAAQIAPALVVEQFLTAVNARDLNTMGSLFGTRDGPVTKIDDKKNVDQRMFALASVLRHDDYKIEGEQVMPGRQNEATQLNVQMTIGPRRVTVPFVLVRTEASTWLVEQICIDRITGGGPSQVCPQQVD